MSSLAMLSIIFGAVAISVLVWTLRREHLREGFAQQIRRRQESARISSMAELIDGGSHIPVALTLERSQIFYESSALQAGLEIARIDEVEYDSEQGTGQNILRLRARGQSLEFVLDPAVAREWAALLPPHRFGDAALHGPLSPMRPQLVARRV
ncbi:MAG TPA: hypothetical protein VKU62_10030 [Thermoanaerobaculia bacterium]|nr:hypothetical protein [Thermoanaerobaculia bacterium]